MRIRIGGRVMNDDSARLYRKYGYQNVCCPQDIRDALAHLSEGEDLTLEINSGGGSAYDGYEMYTVLKNSGRKVTAEIQSIAASAASVIAAAADTVMMSPVASIMAHRASSWAEGNEEDMSQAAQMLRSVDEGILSAYELKCAGKTSREDLKKMMKNETFLTAHEAVEKGLADGVLWDSGDADSALTNSAVAMVGGMGMAMGNLPPLDKLKNLESRNENNNTGKPEEKEETHMTLEELMQTEPDLVQQIRDDAAQTERQRLAAIDDIAMAGFEDLVQAAKTDPKANAGTLAVQMIAKQKSLGKDFLKDREMDIQDGNVGEVGDGGAGEPEDELDAVLNELYGKG